MPTLSRTCQVSRIDPHSMCSRTAVGFLYTDGDNPQAVYEAGIVLCKDHTRALADTDSATEVLTVAELEELCQELSTEQSTREGDTMEVLQNAPVDLTMLAAEVNSRKVEPITAQAPKVIDVPKTGEHAPVAEQTYTDKAAMVAELRKQMAHAREQAQATQAIIDANNLPELAKVGLVNAVKGYEKELATYERQLSKILRANDPVYQFSQASALRASLVVHGGSTVLAHVEALVQAGVLTVKHGALVVTQWESKAEESKPVVPRQSSNEAGTRIRSVSLGSRADNTERNTEIERLYAAGEAESAIQAKLGLTQGQVSGAVHRAQQAGRLAYRGKAA